MRARSSAPTWIWFAGMASLFVGERIIGAGGLRTVFSGLGLVCLLASKAMRLAALRRATDDDKQIQKYLMILQTVGAVSLLLYAWQSDLATSLFGQPLDKNWPKLATSLAALWPALWVFSSLPILFGEISLQSVAAAPKLESARVRDAMLSGVGLAGVIVFGFAICYVAEERDHKVDFSYFRTAKPGESTKKIVATLDQPVQVALFFPPANEVAEQVDSYFDELASASKSLQVFHYDNAVDPVKAKEFGASGNGIIVIARGGRHEMLSVGVELEAARDKLANLDKEVQKRLLQIARPMRTVYLTSGHGERTFTPDNDTDKRLTIHDLRELLQQQGYAVHRLGAGEGLATDVPGDAGVVMIVGPTKPLLPEEIGALGRYVDRGGRLLIALDPDTGVDWKDLLAPLGVKYDPTLLANDQVYGRRTSQISDRANIVTGSYSSHASVQTIARLGMRAPIVLFGSGSFEELSPRPKDLAIDFTVHAMPSTWADKNGNFQFDKDEQRKGWELAAAITKKPAQPADAKDKKQPEEGRVLLLADSDAMADGILGNPGNAYWVLDGTRWLVGDESIAGEVSSEVDTPIIHTRKQDVAWFYLTIFSAPGLVILAGLFMTRRRRGRGVPPSEKPSMKEAA